MAKKTSREHYEGIHDPGLAVRRAAENLRCGGDAYASTPSASTP